MPHDLLLQSLQPKGLLLLSPASCMENQTGRSVHACRFDKEPSLGDYSFGLTPRSPVH